MLGHPLPASGRVTGETTVIRARSKRTDAGSPPPSLRPGGRRNNGYSRSQQANGCWVTPSRPPAGWEAKQRLFALAASERMLGHPLPASGGVGGKQRLFPLAASERMLGHPLPASGRVAGETTVIRARSKRTDAGSPPPGLRPRGRRNNGYSRSQQPTGWWVTPSPATPGGGG